MYVSALWKYASIIYVHNTFYKQNKNWLYGNTLRGFRFGSRAVWMTAQVRIVEAARASKRRRGVYTLGKTARIRRRKYWIYGFISEYGLQMLDYYVVWTSFQKNDERENLRYPYCMGVCKNGLQTWPMKYPFKNTCKHCCTECADVSAELLAVVLFDKIG